MIESIINVVAWAMLIVCSIILAAVVADRLGPLLFVLLGAGWAVSHLFFRD